MNLRRVCQDSSRYHQALERGRLEIRARDAVCLTRILIRPGMRRRTRPRSDVSTYFARIDSPLQRLVRERAHPRILRSPHARR